ncbi:MAG: phospholipid transport system substrate-binding protein [Rickettsiales bacterium]|jgi:phospholipid transport system substrate-binding protein
MKKIILLLTLFFVCANNSFAGEADVRKFIDDLGNKIIKTADDKNLTIKQRRDKLINIVDEVIDAGWISKFVLGRNYRIATKEQRSQFKVLYRDFMIHTYSPQFTGYNGESFVVDSIIDNGNYHTVECSFLTKGDAPTINIDFRVRKNTKTPEKTNFLIFDILAEGISLIETQRSEFGSTIDRDGMEKFMNDLKERTLNIKAEQKSS